MDLNNSLEKQGPFCVLLHKLTDIIAAANQGDIRVCIIYDNFLFLRSLVRSRESEVSYSENIMCVIVVPKIMVGTIPSRIFTFLCYRNLVLVTYTVIDKF